MKRIIITTLFFILPTITFGAVTYSRSPSGTMPTSPITISVSFDDFASDFGSLPEYWTVGLDGDNSGTEIHAVSSDCVAVTTTNANFVFGSLPVGGEVLAIRLYDANESCGDNAVLSPDFLFEGDDENVAFTISASSGGVLFGSNTANVYGLMGAVSTSAFNDVLPWVILIIGILLGFYIVEMLIGTVAPKDERSDKITNDVGKVLGTKETGYHRIFGEKGQEIGWEKDT